MHRKIIGTFHVSPFAGKGENLRFKESYPFILKKSMIIVLSFFILLFHLSKRWDIPHSVPRIREETVYITVEDVPVTKQGLRRKRPLRPVVPIPVEEPAVPEDLTIEPTELNFADSLPGLPGGEGSFSVIPPRPVADVFPDYPDSEKKKGVKGKLELSLLVNKTGKVQFVSVVKNTTNSKVCEKSAVAAAYQTRFIPAKKDQQAVAVWIKKTYTFGLN